MPLCVWALTAPGAGMRKGKGTNTEASLNIQAE